MRMVVHGFRFVGIVPRLIGVTFVVVRLAADLICSSSDVSTWITRV